MRMIESDGLTVDVDDFACQPGLPRFSVVALNPHTLRRLTTPALLLSEVDDTIRAITEAEPDALVKVERLNHQ